jgi:hypothetical protein
MYTVTHPTGLWTFDTYQDAKDHCEDLGDMFDTTACGALKSRCMIMHPPCEDVARAASLIAKCEQSLGYKLSAGHKGDLLADNTDWPLEYIRTILASL